jgi:hypothetical protein
VSAPGALEKARVQRMQRLAAEKRLGVHEVASRSAAAPGTARRSIMPPRE